MLAVRGALFALWQGVFAAGFALSGAAAPWSASVRWWPISFLLANVTCFFLLRALTRAEGVQLRELYGLGAGMWKRDALWFLLYFVLLGPVAMLPSTLLSLALWGDVNAGAARLFQALPLWACAVAFMLPPCIALTELPTYFGYALPRLQAQSRHPWVMVVPAALALALQHAALPLVLEWRFVLWRALAYVPFALVIGWALHRRASLLPWFMGLHLAIDFSIPVYVLMASLRAG